MAPVSPVPDRVMRPAERHLARHCPESLAAGPLQAMENAPLCLRAGQGREGTGRIAALRAIAFPLGLALCSPALAQSSPGSFSLPEPSPSPAPAPQGPVDIRGGVVIGPRAIEEPLIEGPVVEDRAPTPATGQTVRAPAASSRTDPVPSLQPSPQPAPSPMPPAAARAASPQTATTANVAPAESGESEAPAEISAEAGTFADPGIADADGNGPRLPEVTPDQPLELRVYRPGLLDILRAHEGWVLVALALLLAGLALPIRIAARRGRRVKRLPSPERAAQGAAAGGEVLRDRQPKPASMPIPPAAGSPPSPAEGSPRIDLRLDVVGASRSVRTLALDLRVTVSNRSDPAVRGLSIAAKLDCARPGEADAIAVGAGQPLGEISRIGPYQGASLSGSLELPVAELRLIAQGSGRVFIPLVHVTFEGEGEGVPATVRSFVIGTPSASGAGRLHPLPVAAPIGAIHGLAAQLIHIPDRSEAGSRPAHASA